MVSLDAPERNREFAESLGADLVLLSDPTGMNASAYGVAAPGGKYAKRWTVYIDREGVVRAVDRDVRPESAGQDIARKLEELGFPRRSAPR
jgi:peroxiredoxin Q/BCP